ncbi:MAG TPA: hypothetical protein VGC65_12180 [Bacteroidia bacterium]|jgi:hypothetical protein
MKKVILVCIIAIITSTSASAQLMSLGFVKNCMSYDRTALTNELFKKHYEVVERSIATAQNPLLVGAMHYSNEKNPANGEIKVLSLINDSKKIAEIYFVNGTKSNYTNNYAEVFKQMVAFFDNESSFKSTKYDTNVTKFTKDKVHYYTYKIKEIPVIVVANYNIDEAYFK